MATCNLRLLERFDCEALAEKRARANSVIADDQRLRDSLVAQIRHIEIQIAHKRADIEQLRHRLSEPSPPGFISIGRTGRLGRYRLGDLAVNSAPAAAQFVQARRVTRRLEGEIKALERELPALRQALWDRTERLNEAIASRACINTARRAKGCIGA
ncbi:hypothetical protein ABWI01_08650 [Oceanicaulis alexandrii]|uniref:hypothetical protein n=1 Tax=Oceanicaulis alexandrii TaxID=153233 RepID=UPI0035D092FF